MDIKLPNLNTILLLRYNKINNKINRIITLNKHLKAVRANNNNKIPRLQLEYKLVSLLIIVTNRRLISLSKKPMIINLIKMNKRLIKMNKRLISNSMMSIPTHSKMRKNNSYSLLNMMDSSIELFLTPDKSYLYFLYFLLNF